MYSAAGGSQTRTMHEPPYPFWENWRSFGQVCGSPAGADGQLYACHDQVWCFPLRGGGFVVVLRVLNWSEVCPEVYRLVTIWKRVRFHSQHLWQLLLTPIVLCTADGHYVWNSTPKAFLLFIFRSRDCISVNSLKSPTSSMTYLSYWHYKITSAAFCNNNKRDVQSNPIYTGTHIF